MKDGKEPPKFTCSVVDSGRAIKIDGLFKHGSTFYYQALSITIPGLQNPRYVDVPSGSFALLVYEDIVMAH